MDIESQLLYKNVTTSWMQAKKVEAYLQHLKNLLEQAEESLAKKPRSTLMLDY